MERLEQSGNIYVADSGIEGAGRGVFAQNTFAAGDIIERCPVIKVPFGDQSYSGVMADYYFYYGDAYAFALGFGSLYNHSYEPNATYEPKPGEGHIEFRAIGEIASGEEITVNYKLGYPNDASHTIARGVAPARHFRLLEGYS
jgi:hypothetical protein